MPTLRQIEYFLAVADIGTFTQASAALFVAQSALSRQISQLEEELGFSLFQREPRGVRLTPAGALFRSRVASLPKVLATARDEGIQLARGEAGVLRVLHSSTIPTVSLIPALDQFLALSPNARIDLDRASSEQQISEIADGNADVGIVRLPVLRRDARVRLIELTAERLWVAVPEDHPFAGYDRITVSTLEHEMFVSALSHEKGGLARVVTDLCLKRGFVPQRAQIVSPKTSMLNLVGASRGIAVVPERMTMLQIKGVTYVPLTDDDAESSCALVMPLQHSLLAETFANLFLDGRSPA